MQADAHALEVAIHRKRAERERKRQELEAEFAAVFQEVSRKKHALERLEVSIADMDAWRKVTRMIVVTGVVTPVRPSAAAIMVGSK